MHNIPWKVFKVGTNWRVSFQQSKSKFYSLVAYKVYNQPSKNTRLPMIPGILAKKDTRNTSKKEKTRG